MAVFATVPAEHFDPAEFNALIAAHGAPALWRKSTSCPCFDPRTEQPKVNCPWCDQGMVWDDGTPTVIHAAGRARKDQYDDLGMIMAGMSVFTFPETTTPGHLDRIDLLVAEMVVNNERFVRGAVNRLNRSLERTRLTPVAGGVVLAIVDDALVFYTAADVMIWPDGAITWADGHGPANGIAYSVRYIARPAYVVWSPQSRDEGAQKMPYRAVVQRLDFFQRRTVEA